MWQESWQQFDKDYKDFAANSRNVLCVAMMF
jgi:hypothetical protein